MTALFLYKSYIYVWAWSITHTFWLSICCLLWLFLLGWCTSYLKTYDTEHKEHWVVLVLFDWAFAVYCDCFFCDWKDMTQRARVLNSAKWHLLTEHSLSAVTVSFVSIHCLCMYKLIPLADLYIIYIYNLLSLILRAVSWHRHWAAGGRPLPERRFLNESINPQLEIHKLKKKISTTPLQQLLEPLTSRAARPGTLAQVPCTRIV